MGAKGEYGVPDMGVKGFDWVWCACDGCKPVRGFKCVEGLGWSWKALLCIEGIGMWEWVDMGMKGLGE